MGPNADSMPIHSESDSWLSRRSIAAKLAAIILVFVCIIMALLAVVSLSSAVDTGVRAYVVAEGLWSKGQKDAVYYLTRYARSREEQDYRKYLAAIAIPLGDRAARLEMEKPSYDYGAAERGFTQGGNSLAETPYMIFVFRYFHDVPHLAEAIRIWTEADVHIARLTQAADEVHAAVLSGALASERATAHLNQIEDINARLTPLELDFSAAMGEGSRWIRHVILITIFSTAALLLVVGLWVSWRIARDLRAGILSLRQGALRVAQGDLDHLIAIHSHDELGELATVFNEMIAHRKDAEERLLELAHFDPLTGLPNRRHYTKSLEQALVLATAQTVSVSVLFIDLDRFKNVNDTLGHSLGDDLLRKVSARIIKCLRTSDILGRLGGDEFALILMNSSEVRATAIVANTIINELHRPFDLDGHEVTVTASIGITVFPADSSDAATLMKYADTAMYEAKNAGRDTYRFYNSEMYTHAQEKHDLENALRRAIDHDEFELYYQPTMQIDTGQWTGVEALLRWRRPGHGLILPADFIPTLEETGLIVPVGAWVINSACKQIAEWEHSGIGSIAIAVNVSGRQFTQGDKIQEEMPALRDDDSSFPLLDFVRGAEKALSEHHIAASLLAFELTESTLMSEAERTVDILHKLKLLGIRISIDDFGTGYSSLAYLRRFPIDTLKIDQAFIRDVTTNAEDATITQAIINMAHSLKLKALAEGVETTEQLEFLRTNGCDQAQGYLLARPMPAAELAKLFRAGRVYARQRQFPAPHN